MSKRGYDHSTDVAKAICKEVETAERQNNMISISNLAKAVKCDYEIIKMVIQKSPHLVVFKAGNGCYVQQACLLDERAIKKTASLLTQVSKKIGEKKKSTPAYARKISILEDEVNELRKAMNEILKENITLKKSLNLHWSVVVFLCESFGINRFDAAMGGDKVIEKEREDLHQRTTP
jgi:hypothetical protein